MATEEAVQSHGGYDYIDVFVVERHWRDVKLCTIGEGTREVIFSWRLLHQADA